MDFSTHSENHIFMVENGLPAKDAHVRLIWGHGWGQDHRVFEQLAKSLQTQAHNLLLDFPGFGQSPPPSKVYGTIDYACETAGRLQSLPFQGKTIWVGHSFGGRVGLQLAANYPDMLDGLILIAGSGLPRKRSFCKKVCFKSRIYTFKLLKRIWILLGKNVDTLRQRFGSLDYRNAGVLRETFMKVIAEDLSEAASKIKCPVLLIYGTNDTETPPEIGERLHKLIPKARLVILDGQDHYSLLAGGRHQTLKHLHGFIKDLV
ncbi:MAG: alpha/beta hydrolase [Alphaproteobacteria bacterium]|nr:alpha/beta hydrolase [Alphaproteobacteria bacterium]MCK5555929.1 alpha/beta hydrolase [Alphaproteobacteria bacterium]MCK5659488.1 alpha/beta hydrolase [Alphaproteobacteria bacterium]